MASPWLHRYRFVLVGVAVAGAVAVAALLTLRERSENWVGAPEGFIGSESCRGCHEEFYQLWAPSHHGLAMQPYTEEFAKAELSPPTEEIRVGESGYRAGVGAGEGWVTEQDATGRSRRLRIEHVMGGKNVYYFLTQLDRGRLQVLPVAYDVEAKRWFDTAASAVRHFGDASDEPLDWRDRAYTFNTSCYGCHVSQITKNYDLETDSYHTVWAEPGINCETCHGPAAEHVRYCEESEEACAEDVRLIKTGDLDTEQVDTMCAACHAKAAPLSPDFRPGDRFFNHFDLATLEHPDYYPDGRDLGENYTYTSWLASPCRRSPEMGRSSKTGGSPQTEGSPQMDCVHCHTSSGRFRFEGEQANQACMPCHEEKVSNPTAHTRHAEASPGSECIACHMPMTEFAQMRRSDHSMRPPTPAATIQFKSPNACNLCHTDRSAEWADEAVRSWQSRDYQAPVLRRAELIDAARREDWSRLPEMLGELEAGGADEVYTTSLVRLLRGSEEESVWPAILKRLGDPSPLVRGSAAEALSNWLTPEAVASLVKATGDDYRLVRIRAAAALASVPRERFSARELAEVERAEKELLASLDARPDDASSHANRGNYYISRHDLARAIQSFENALRLEPENVMARVNASLAYNMAGRNEEAERSLRAALAQDPGNAAANFNLGLLMGEMGRIAEAKQALGKALETEPDMAAAAYNLCVLEADENPGSAIEWCQKAAESRPQEPRYAYALAFHLRQAGRAEEALSVLQELGSRHPDYLEGQMLLAQVLEERGDGRGAGEVYRRILESESLSAEERRLIEARLAMVR